MPECVHLLDRYRERHVFPPRDDGDAHLLVAPAHRLWRLSREALRWRYEQVGVPVVTWREGVPLAASIEEVNAFRHLARPA